MMGGMGKLLGAVGRAASMLGNAGVARTVGDVYIGQRDGVASCRRGV